jgi:hypothetical protein
MAGNSVHTIGSGKPKASGGILHAPLGIALPTDIAAAPNVGFKKLGYVGEDGLQPGGERTLEEKRDWGGDVIANIQSGHSSSFQFTLLAAFDPDVLNAVFGEANVTVTAATASSGTLITVAEDGSDLPYGEWIFEMASGPRKQRIVVPNGQIGTVEELPFVSNDLQGFTVSVNCYKDEAGIKVYRYYDDGKFDAA